MWKRGCRVLHPPHETGERLEPVIAMAAPRVYFTNRDGTPVQRGERPPLSPATTT